MVFGTLVSGGKLLILMTVDFDLNMQVDPYAAHETRGGKAFIGGRLKCQSRALVRAIVSMGFLEDILIGSVSKGINVRLIWQAYKS